MIEYDLHRLGWKSFQDLCHTVIGEILGQEVESYLSSHDGGRDGAFAGTWIQDGQEDLTGSFVIQCKSTSKANRSLRPSDVKDELAKVRTLVESGRCDSYILMTNFNVSGDRAAEISDMLESEGVKHCRVFGAEWLNLKISESSRLRRHVPRLYGLGDLSQILDERAYKQSRAVLESMRDDLAKVVITDAYQRALKAIDDHRFVLIVGEPASGKTTIASLLAMAALDDDEEGQELSSPKASLIKASSPSDFEARWNPNEPTQVFWVDDAFGATQYERDLVRRWNLVLPQQLPAMLRRSARVIMTSRDYIYAQAREELKQNSFPVLNEAKVVIDVQELSIEEKRQILYNHIKLGHQPQSFRSEIKPYLEAASSRPRFIPEVARRLGDPGFTANLPMRESGVIEFFDKPEALLRDTIRQLDANSKSALALVFMRNDRLESPIDPQDAEELAISRLGGSLKGCISALDAMNGTFVRLADSGGDRAWRFQHPTVGDAYASLMAENPEHIEIFVQGSSAERLVRQVTCGGMGLQGAVVIPTPLFTSMAAKLRDAHSQWGHQGDRPRRGLSSESLESFLAHRCSDSFLHEYLKHDSSLVDRIASPMPMLDVGSETALAARLLEAGLFPEECRARFVEEVKRLTLDATDTGVFTHKPARKVFTSSEYNALVEEIRSEMLPKLSGIVREQLSSIISDMTAEELGYSMVDVLNGLKQPFGDDPTALRKIKRCVEEVWEWVEEQESEQEEDEPARPREVARAAGDPLPQGDRSIFDDIDADE